MYKQIMTKMNPGITVALGTVVIILTFWFFTKSDPLFGEPSWEYTKKCEIVNLRIYAAKCSFYYEIENEYKQCTLWTEYTIFIVDEKYKEPLFEIKYNPKTYDGNIRNILNNYDNYWGNIKDYELRLYVNKQVFEHFKR